MTGNLQADGVQSRQTLFVRYCLKITHTAWFPFFGKHMRCVCCVSGECPLLHFPAKKPLTNAAFWRIIKVKREHTSRRSAPMLSYQEITVQVSSSGRLFPFMVMMIGKQNCCLNQCKYEPCKKTQLLPCYKILHIHHLPSIIKIMGAWKRPPTVIGMPSNLSIPYFDKNVK